MALTSRWETVAGIDVLPEPGTVVVAVLANFAANFTLAAAWRRVLAAGGWPLDRVVAAWVWGASQLARYTLGAAQVGGRAVLASREGVPGAAGAATTVIETLWQTSLTAAVVLATLPWWLPGAGGLAWVGWTASAPVAVLAAGLLRPDVLLRGVRWVLARGWMAPLTGGLSGAAVTLDRSTAARITGWFGLNTVLRVAGFVVLLAGLGGDLTEVGLQAVGAYALGHIVGQLAVVVPAGIGPREGASALALTPVLGGAAALALVAVVRLVEIVAELAFVGTARVLLVLTRDRQSQRS